MHKARRRNVSDAIDWADGKSTGAFTPSKVASRPQQMDPTAIWLREITQLGTTHEGKHASDNSPVGVFVFLGFATRVINALAC